MDDRKTLEAQKDQTVKNGVPVGSHPERGATALTVSVPEPTFPALEDRSPDDTTSVASRVNGGPKPVTAYHNSGYLDEDYDLTENPHLTKWCTLS